MGFTHCVCGSLFTLFSNKNVTKVLTLQHLIQNRDLKKHVAHLQAGRHSPDYPPGPRVCRSSKCQCSKNMQYHLACLPCAPLNVMKWHHFRIKTTRRGGEWKCIHPPASLLTGIAGPRPADGQAKPGIHSGGGVQHSSGSPGARSKLLVAMSTWRLGFVEPWCIQLYNYNLYILLQLINAEISVSDEARFLAKRVDLDSLLPRPYTQEIMDG